MGKFEEIVEMMIDKAKSFKLELEAKDNYGKTGFDLMNEYVINSVHSRNTGFVRQRKNVHWL